MKGTEKRRMGMVGAVVAVAFVVAGMLPLFHSGDRALAEEGCCMHRQCPDDKCPWYQYAGDRNSCEKLNDEKDGDDVESESGLIWWSQDC